MKTDLLCLGPLSKNQTMCCSYQLFLRGEEEISLANHAVTRNTVPLVV